MKTKARTTGKKAAVRAGCVRLELAHPAARKVRIAGFNDWHPAAAPMIRLGDGNRARQRD